MYKNESGINNLQWLMCHKIKPNKFNLKSLKQDILLRALLATAVEYTDWIDG